MESQLQERVESSRRAVSQIVTVYDKLQEKVDLLSRKLNSGGEARSWSLGALGRGDLSPVRLRVQPSGRMCLDMHWALASVPSTKKQKRREHSLIKFLRVLNLVTKCAEHDHADYKLL